LEAICGVALHIIFGCIYLTLFDVSVHSLWLTFSSVTLAFVFVFGNSIRTIYESVIYLFVVHPFDVGDYLLLNTGDTVKVQEIALMFCTFLKQDGRLLFYPAAKLTVEPAINLSRSQRYWDTVKFTVEMDINASAILKAERLLRQFLLSKPTEYTGRASLTVLGFDGTPFVGPPRLQISARWELSHEGAESSRTNRQHQEVVLALRKAFQMDSETGAEAIFKENGQGGRKNSRRNTSNKKNGARTDVTVEMDPYIETFATVNVGDAIKASNNAADAATSAATTLTTHDISSAFTVI